MRAFLVVTLLASFAATRPPQNSDAPTCSVSQECREMALQAAERSEYETFHTLAWRAVQTGKKNDPALMYLLARAQSLSGRPNDALVMLRRLAGMGVGAVEAETSDDFVRVRSMPQWPEIRSAIQQAVGTGPLPSMTSARSTLSAPSVVLSPFAAGIPTAVPAPLAGPPAPSTSAEPSPVDAIEGRSIPAARLTPLAMAYDAVSRRFVFADERSDTLKIIDDLTGNVVDLVSPRWAGLYRTSALAIDSRRGDLWVVGARDADADSGATSAVHRMQLVSGRLLYTIPLPIEAGAARFAEVTVTDSGIVFVLDSVGRRIFRVEPGATSLRLQMDVDVIDPTSIAAAGDAVIYVAHSGGITRLNLATRTSTPLQVGNGLTLDGLQWIGWHTGSLVGIQRRAEGLTAIRIGLDRRGSTATQLHVLDHAASRAASVAAGMFYYLTTDPVRDATTVRRLMLR